MFNNPFNSFHDTVAEAKEEREQLDRLLTISTPRERLLVAAIALMLSVVLGWLFLGNVSRSLAFEGVLVEPEEIPVDGNRSVQALVWIRSDVGQQIVPGMPAALELAMADGERGKLDGEIATITALPLSEEVAALGPAPPVSAHRLAILLDPDTDRASLAGSKARIVIGLGRQPPATIFGMRR
ncbi:MAG: hypothetical protein OXP09_16325 [Gammaproteobacteria bacterium]|nr:hypothetical protein [Gammaproteobacteria bacterium]